MDVYRPCLLGALSAASAAFDSSITIDKGHRASSGKTTVEFWIKQPQLVTSTDVAANVEDVLGYLTTTPLALNPEAEVFVPTVSLPAKVKTILPKPFPVANRSPDVDAVSGIRKAMVQHSSERIDLIVNNVKQGLPESPPGPELFDSIVDLVVDRMEKLREPLFVAHARCSPAVADQCWEDLRTVVTQLVHKKVRESWGNSDEG